MWLDLKSGHLIGFERLELTAAPQPRVTFGFKTPFRTSLVLGEYKCGEDLSVQIVLSDFPEEDDGQAIAFRLKVKGEQDKYARSLFLTGDGEFIFFKTDKGRTLVSSWRLPEDFIDFLVRCSKNLTWD
jgi:hypothetical protein